MSIVDEPHYNFVIFHCPKKPRALVCSLESSLSYDYKLNNITSSASGFIGRGLQPQVTCLATSLNAESYGKLHVYLFRKTLHSTIFLASAVNVLTTILLMVFICERVRCQLPLMKLTSVHLKISLVGAPPVEGAPPAEGAEGAPPAEGE